MPAPTPEAKPRAKKVWLPKTHEDFAHVSVMSFDQTINHTGVVWLDNRSGEPYIRSMAYFPSPKDELKSFEATLQRTAILEETLVVWLLGQRDAGAMSRNFPDYFVHEMPAVHGFRTESSLMAAYAVRRAVESVYGQDCAVVNNQHAKAVLLGPAAKEKADVKAMVNALVPDHRRPAKPWNEHTSDAAMIGLTHLYDLKAAAK